MDIPESWWVHPQGLCNHHVQIGQAFLQAAVPRGWLRQGTKGGGVRRTLTALGLFHGPLLQLQQTFLWKSHQMKSRSHPDGLSVALRHSQLASYHYQRPGSAVWDLGIFGYNVERSGVMVGVVHLTEGRVTWERGLQCIILTGLTEGRRPTHRGWPHSLGRRFWGQ